jgi:putative transcriptional regulator
MNNRLRELRGRRSQAEVAVQIGITQAHYCYIENGARTPSLPVAIRLAKLFKVKIEDIFITE